MRILQVIHDFLPRHNAGSEIYTYKLSKELIRTGHEVSLFFTEIVPEKEQYTRREGNYDGIPFTEVVFNNHFIDLTHTYRNPFMNRIFRDVLNERKPDVLHIQHLNYHSLDYIRMAKKREIPVVYTLHEFCLICPGGGQIFKDGKVCKERGEEVCSRCLSRYPLRPSLGRRLRYRIDVWAKTHLSEKFRSKVRKYLLRKEKPEGEPLERKGQEEPQRREEKEDSPSGEGAGRERREHLSDGYFQGMPVEGVRALIPLKKDYVRGLRNRRESIAKACSLVDLFISPSDFLRRFFIREGLVREDQIIFSDNGIDVSPFQNFRKKPSANLRFGFIGSIVDYKGVHTLVNAFNRIRDPRAVLYIYGDLDAFRDYSVRVRKSARNPAIRFNGKFDNRLVARIFSGIDVLVVPSIWYENSPLTIHEAFLSRTAVITANHGGMADLIQDGVNGFLFEPGGEASLYKTIQKIIDRPALMEETVRNAPPVKTIEEDTRDMEGRYERLLRGERVTYP